jgi:putative chitinase
MTRQPGSGAVMSTLQAAVKQVAPRANREFVQALIPAADAAAARWGISDAAVVARFLAQNHHETQGFTKFTENMNYSAARLMQVWPARFPSLAAAKPYANNPIALANNVYANRMGNGPPSSGDGWRHRGGGLTHHTGKAEYARAFARTGRTPDEIRNPAKAVAMVDAAASYWADRNVVEAAKRGDDRAVTIRINGGLIGHQDRLVLTRRYLAVVTNGIMPKERTRAETSQVQRSRALMAASGGTASGGSTVAVPAAAPQSGGSNAWLVAGGLVLAVALIGVAVVLIRKARRTEATLEAERQAIVDSRSTVEA